MDKVQGSPEWLEMRKSKIGASDAPIIMGVSPWKTAYELWEEKTGRKESPIMTPWMKRGHDLEPIARSNFEKLIDEDVFPDVIFHEEHDFLMASLDGISMDGKTLVEIKCPGKEAHSIAMAGNIPEHYMPQLQHQLMITGLDKMYYYSFDGNDGIPIVVNRDDDYIKELLAKELEFWEHMQNDTAPKKPEPKYVSRDDEEWINLSSRLKELQPLVKEYEQCKKDLIALSEGINSEGHGVRVSSYSRSGSIDYAKIPELKDVDLEAYRKKPSISSRITLYDNNP